MIKYLTKSDNLSHSWWKDILILLFGITLIYSILLSYRPLSVPDEARYAEIPREMVATGNYLTPHLNYIKYFEKPVLFYWMQAAAIKMLGDNELAIRIPNALMAILGCLLTYGLGTLTFNRRVGIVSALILASSSLYFVMAHLVTLDMTLSTFVTASFFSFLLGNSLTKPSNKRLAFYGFYIASALAVLTKGLIGIIFPAMVIGSWILLLNDWQLLKRIYLPSGIIIFLLVAVPWHILVQLKNPEFLKFYLLDQQFLRYFTNEANRSQPPGFFIPVLCLGFLPWSIFILQAFHFHLTKSWKKRQEHKGTLFLLLWSSLIFTFFLFSHSQLIPYLLPIFSPLSVLVGAYLVAQWPKVNQKKSVQVFAGTKWGYSLIPFLICFTALGALIVNYYHKILVLGDIKNELILLAVFWFSSSAIAAFFIWRDKAVKAFLSIFAGSILAYFIVLIAMPKADTRSIKPLALQIQANLKPDDEVVCYDTYYQDLPFYLKRRVTIVDWQNELQFGMQHQDTSQWMIPTGTFWQLWASPKKVYMLTDYDTYANLKQLGQYPMYLLARTPGDVLVVNHQ